MWTKVARLKSTNLERIPHFREDTLPSLPRQELESLSGLVEYHPSCRHVIFTRRALGADRL